jgi:hypothetical protein
MRPPRRLAKRARSIFEELGYEVETGTRTEFRAERAWKAVTVTTVSDRPVVEDGDGGMRCFVTDGDPDALRGELRESNPDYEYAIISVGEEDYEVVRAPPVGR